MLTAFIETVTESISDGEILSLRSFGTFRVRDRAAHKGRNPQTGEVMQIPATKHPVFVPSEYLKRAVKKQGN